jgi:hypothetical protein
MQGECSVCGQQGLDIRLCPLCGDPVGVCCYLLDKRCCIHCGLEFFTDDEENE